VCSLAVPGRPFVGRFCERRCACMWQCSLRGMHAPWWHNTSMRASRVITHCTVCASSGLIMPLLSGRLDTRSNHSIPQVRAPRIPTKPRVCDRKSVKSCLWTLILSSMGTEPADTQLLTLACLINIQRSCKTSCAGYLDSVDAVPKISAWRNLC
jgi:hypothetical protein